MVLKNAWNHVEALQTSDLLGLINHICDVWDTALRHPATLEHSILNGDLHQRQEILCFYYLRGVMRHIEEISEGRLVTVVEVDVNRNYFKHSIDLLYAVPGVVAVNVI